MYQAMFLVFLATVHDPAFIFLLSISWNVFLDLFAMCLFGLLTCACFDRNLSHFVNKTNLYIVLYLVYTNFIMNLM